jgi:hypothetical protein
MRKTISILLIITTSFSFGQNYKLFNSSTKKLFTDYPVPKNTYSLAFDTVISSGNDTVYYNFFLADFNNNIFNSPCNTSFYPCVPQNIPSWIGRKIISDNISNYDFFNLSNDTLSFNFTTNLNDTLVFYKNSSQKFLFVYKKTDTLNILNIVDSVRYYTIINTDLSGNIINSALNQQNIVVSKNYGLVNFFRIDSFPQVLQPIVLIGNKSPAIGLYELSNEIVFDYQPGDVLQYHDYYYSNPLSPNYNRYKKYTILSRTITADSLIYLVDYEMFNVDSINLFTDTVMLKYCRNTIIATIPFEKYDYQGNKYFGLDDYNGVKLWTYKINNAFDGCNYLYCQLDTSWCYDGEDPPIMTHTNYVIGLGLFENHSLYMSVIPDGNWTRDLNLIYFKKNGETWGSQMFAGINEYNNINCKIIISPNPAMNNIEITSPFSLLNISLYNLQGQTVLSKNISGTNTIVDIGQLHEGVYLAKILLNNNLIVTKKIIKLKD